MVVVDALDVGFRSRDASEKSGSVAELLAAYQHLLPSWLLLVCSVRRHNKAMCKMFSGTKTQTLFLITKNIGWLSILQIKKSIDMVGGDKLIATYDNEKGNKTNTGLIIS